MDFRWLFSLCIAGVLLCMGVLEKRKYDRYLREGIRVRCKVLHKRKSTAISEHITMRLSVLKRKERRSNRRSVILLPYKKKSKKRCALFICRVNPKKRCLKYSLKTAEAQQVRSLRRF